MRKFGHVIDDKGYYQFERVFIWPGKRRKYVILQAPPVDFMNPRWNGVMWVDGNNGILSAIWRKIKRIINNA